MNKLLIFQILSLVLFLALGCTPKNVDVIVSVKKKQKIMTSNFEIGVTHTHVRWETGHPDTVKRIYKQLGEAIRFHNQHITHWGVGEDLMLAPGVYNWDSLDYRMNIIRSIDNSIPIITFCGAPTWMKDHNPNVRWQVEARVRDENVPDYAGLCKQVALRYPDVEYFQVWNEFKGYDDGKKDVERFTVFYNAIYDSVRTVRPNIFIGGPYIPLRDPENDLTEHDIDVVNYWLANSRGADFFTYDGWLEGWPPGGRTDEWMMKGTDYFGKISRQFNLMSNMPVWVSEFYGAQVRNKPDFFAASHASCYLHSLLAGVQMVLLWDAVGLGQLFTRFNTDGSGGQPTPHYEVVKAFNQYFRQGTPICKTESSSELVEVLASPVKTMLINKSPNPQTVSVNRVVISLDIYEVKVIDTP